MSFVHPGPEDALQRWLLFMEQPKEEVLKMLEAKDPVIARAVKVLDLLSSDPETVRLSELRDKALWDEVSRLNSARRDGLAEGLEKGRAEGQAQIVRALAAKGFSIADIANLTSLSADEVERLLRLEQ